MSDDTTGQESENTEVETEEVEETSTEVSTLTKEQLLKINKKLQNEAAAKRVKNKELDSELDEFRKWKDSQLSESEKTAKRLEELQKENQGLLLDSQRTKLQREFDLDDDDLEFLSGDEAEMRRRAEKLAKRAGKYDDNGEQAAKDNLFGGKRGTAVKPAKSTAWLSDMLNGK